jgi:hypothetical protein
VVLPVSPVKLVDTEIEVLPYIRTTTANPVPDELVPAVVLLRLAVSVNIWPPLGTANIARSTAPTEKIVDMGMRLRWDEKK